MKKLPFIYCLFRGAIGKAFVIKHYKYGIVKTKFPDMSRIVVSKKQRVCRNLFKEAVAYAKAINNDAALKKSWTKRIRKGRVYNAAIRAYMRAAKENNRLVTGAEKKHSASRLTIAYRQDYSFADLLHGFTTKPYLTCRCLLPLFETG